MVTPRNIIPGIRVESTVETYYTVPLNTRCIVKKVTLTNDDMGAAYTVDIWIVPSGGTPIAGNKIGENVAVGPTETKEIFFLENVVMEAGATLQMQASTGNKLTLFGSGIEIV
jgi:hypothetical protein